jgi:hypothetical protein
MGKRFRVAFSFAGEKRNFISSVADILAKQFGVEKILYDKYHESELSRPDLAFYLPKLYKDNCDLVVTVFCKDYIAKEWCGLEWRAIYSLTKEREDMAILLSRFDHAEADGLFGLAGYINLDQLNANQFADLIFERLAINEGKPRGFYKSKAESATQAVNTIGKANKLINYLLSLCNSRPLEESLQSFYALSYIACDLSLELLPSTLTYSESQDAPIDSALLNDRFQEYERKIKSILESMVYIFKSLTPPGTRLWSHARERRDDGNFYMIDRAGQYNLKRSLSSDKLSMDKSIIISRLKDNFRYSGIPVLITGSSKGPLMWGFNTNDIYGEDKSVILGAVITRTWNPRCQSWENPKLAWILGISSDRENAFTEIHVQAMKLCIQIFSPFANIKARCQG